MKTIRISANLDVPIDICTEAVAWIGARGSGKTHGAGKLVELMLEAGVPVVILDPVGVWYGLRLAKDGKGAGLSIPVFGGLHGDIPLEPTAGALIADLICDKNLSAVLDVSQFESDAETARFVAAFSERLFLRKKKAPSVICMVLDEGQEFLPQNPQPGEQQMLHRLIRQIKIGRNFGMGVFILSPRPQEINKKALNGCQTVLAFRLTGAHERKAMKDWIAAHDVDQSVIEKLPSLETGNCHVWSPAFLKVSKEIRILPKTTFDASATPKFGEHRAARELAPIDLERLRTAMAATIEKAKADDPKELRARIAALERARGTRAETTAKIMAAPPKIQIVEKPILRAGELDRLEKLLERAGKHSDKVLVAHRESIDVLGKLTALIHDARRPLDRPARPSVPLRDFGGVKFASAETVRAARGETAPAGDLGPAHRRVLSALAWLEQRGVLPAPRAQVAVLAGMTPSSGYYERLVGELKTGGMVIYPAGGLLALTETGRAIADPGAAHQTSEDIQADIMRRLGPSHQKVLKVAIDAYPNPATRSWVAEQASMAPGSGYYERLVGELKTMGVMTYPGKGMLRASDILFVKE